MKPQHPTERLSEYLDGGLSEARHAEVKAHLDGCASCRGVLKDLESVVRRAGELGPVAPPADLWPHIRERIAWTGTPLRVESGSGRSGAGKGRRPVSLTHAAAAAVLLSVFSAGSTWIVLRGSDNQPAPASQAAAPGQDTRLALVSAGIPEELSRELELLEQTLVASQAKLNPTTRNIVERNLAIIDQAIRESLEALAAEPSDPFLEGHLEAQLRRKVRVLRTVTGLSAAD